MKVKADEHYPQEPKEEEDGGGPKRWPVPEVQHDRKKDQDNDADI